MFISFTILFQFSGNYLSTEEKPILGLTSGEEAKI